MKTVLIFSLIIILGFGHTLQAQDLVFSQFQVIPSLNNPAMAGLHDDFTLQFHHRNQPVSTGESFTTTALWMAYPLLDKHKKQAWGNVSLSVFNHNQLQILSFNGGVLGLNYNLNFPKHRISFAMQGGLMQQAFRLTNFNTRNQYQLGIGFDPNLASGENFDNRQKVYPLLSAGLNWSMKNATGREEGYFGIALMNLNRPDVSFLGQMEGQPKFRLSPNLIIQGGWEIWDEGAFYIQPNFRWIKRQEQAFYHLGSWFGLELPEYLCKGPIKKGRLKLGLWYYSNQALTAAIQFEQPAYQLSFGYDTPLANTSNVWLGNGAVELGLTIRFPRNKKTREIKDDGLQVLDSQPLYTEVKDSSLLNFQTIETIPQAPQEVTVVTFSSWDFEPFYVKFKEADLIVEASVQELNEFIDYWQYYKDTEILIEGYAYNHGKESNNQDISVQLAEKVKNYFIQGGIDEHKIEIKGMANQKITIIGDNIQGNKNYLVRISPKTLSE